MDAASPLGRWLFVLGLLALGGCKSADPSAAVNARGQSPPELPGPLYPAPLAPVAPPQPMPQGGAFNTLQSLPTGGSQSTPGPVQGFPVETATPRPPVQGEPVGTGPVTQASMVALAPEQSRFLDPTKHVTTSLEPARLITGIPQIKIAAIVGVSANIITDQEVKEEVRKHLGDYRNLTGDERRKKEKELYREELGRMIARELILDDMFARLKKDNKSTDDIKEMAGQETDRVLRSIQKQQGARTEQEFIDQLRAQGLSIPGLRRQIERQMMADEYIRSMLKETGRNPGFTEIRRYYEMHPEEFEIKDRVRWQDLFINFNKYPSRELAHARAEQVKQMIVTGTDFVSLIKEEENSPRGRQNWDGIGTSREDVPIDVASTVFSLSPGQTSGIVSTPTGFHIIKVLEREYAGVRPLDYNVQNDCRDKLKKEYREGDAKKVIEELWRRGTVQVFDLN